MGALDSLLNNIKSGGQSVVEFVTPPAPQLDPAAALIKMQLPPKLCERIKPLLAKNGATVLDEAPAEDPYGGTVRRYYTAIRDARGERAALLSMPDWVLGDGNHIANIESVRYLFRGRVIRLLAEKLDIPWFKLDDRLAAWRAQDGIDGRFVPWTYFVRALEGTHDLAEVLKIDLNDSGGVPMAAPKKVRIFISYAHEDENYMTKLVKHLSILKQQGLIEAWHDRKIGAGREWAGAIDENLEKAEIILLLVSADFVASEYCSDVELKHAMQRHETKSARVIPVIVRQVDWTKAPFGKLRALPEDGKPVRSWSDDDEAFTNIAQGIRNVVEEITGGG